MLDSPAYPRPVGATVGGIELLSISSDITGEVATLTISGEIDIFTAAQIKHAIDDSYTRGVRRIILDLSSVTFIDARGIDTLVQASLEARKLGGELVIRHPSASVLRMEKLINLDERLLPLDS